MEYGKFKKKFKLNFLFIKFMKLIIKQVKYFEQSNKINFFFPFFLKKFIQI